MKRNYYLVMTIAQRLAHKDSAEIIKEIFPESDVQDHIIEKFAGIRSRRQCFFNALFDLYMALDSPSQLEFDRWMNNALVAVDECTVQHFMV
jgi:hypothetical protein